MYSPCHHCANQHPHKSRKISELNGQHRTDKRTCTCDGGKVVSKKNPFICWIIVLPIVQTVGRRDPRRVNSQYFCANKTEVKTICKCEDHQGTYHQIHCIH